MRSLHPVGDGKRSDEMLRSAPRSLCPGPCLSAPDLALDPCPALSQPLAETRTGSPRGACVSEGACASQRCQSCDKEGNREEEEGEEEETRADLCGTPWALEEELREARRNSET